MGTPGRKAPRVRRHAAATLLAFAVVAAGCASDEDSEATAPPPLEPETTVPESTTTPPCSESRHTVAFDVLGTLTLEDVLGPPALGGGLALSPRPGAAAVATAYLDRGYDIIYVGAVPGDTPVAGVPFADALAGWLAVNGFPTGERTRIWTWTEGDDPVVALVQELLRMAQADVSVDAGYTASLPTAHAMASGGVPADGLWTFGGARDAPGSTPLPGGDIGAHLSTVERLGMVCQPG